jgi:hypothetical protein
MPHAQHRIAAAASRHSRSYQFSEQLESFSSHNKKRQDEAAEILDRLARNAG